jgi:pyruvate dehydrogenase E2 component (dihydrolipoamide acetyltransferase)/2-oxoisovalerate dehydrogenase E2 component (dihydrolipoyl transacylase)
MDFALPELGEGVYEAEVVRWLVKPGDSVKRGQSLLEVLTDKATMEVPSPFIGKITSLNVEPGQQVKVGSIILGYDGAATATAKSAEPAAPTTVRAEVAPQRETVSVRSSANGAMTTTAARAVKAAPSVRHMARRLGIDLTRVAGTGPGGRILADDLASAVLQSSRPASETKAPAQPQLDVGVAGTKIKMAGLRRRIAEHMVESKKAIPHYTYIDEVDITDLVQLRRLAADHFGQRGIKLTYLAFFVRAAVLALKETPIVNSTYDEKAGEINLHNQYHIGIAVATPAGLIVPVIRDADRLDISEIAKEIDRLGSEARAGKSKRADLSGGTFTITSIGGIGGLISTPIINHPEVAILGLGKVVKRPVYDDAGNVKPADMIYMSISFDHRIVDGAIGALFGNALVKHLKQPAGLLLSAKS